MARVNPKTQKKMLRHAKGNTEGTWREHGNIQGNRAGTLAYAKMAAHTADPAEYAQPPCRVAGKYVAPCPLCGRELSLKTLRYKHFCGDGARDTEAHSLSQQAAAEKAVRERMRARSAATVHPSAPVGSGATSAQEQRWQNLLAASFR